MPSSPAVEPPSPGALPKPEAPGLGKTRLGSLLMRVALALTGAGFFVGFFMPWAVLAGGRGGSGFDLLVGRSEIVELLFQPSRPMLLLVPMFGVLLLTGAVTAHRIALWGALLAGVSLLGYGFYTLATVFLQATGVGMWIVVGSACASLALGMFGLGALRDSRSPEP